MRNSGGPLQERKKSKANTTVARAKRAVAHGRRLRRSRGAEGSSMGGEKPGVV
jgi:hypothetical protein